MGTLTLLYRHLCLIKPGSPLFSFPPRSNSGIQKPTPMFSSLLFGHSLSFCPVNFKATEDLQPGATDSSVKERQWGAQHWLGPNTEYKLLHSRGSVLHALRTGDLAESLTPRLASLHWRKGLTGLGFRMRRPKSQEPSVQSRQVEAGIGSVSMSVCVFAGLCPAAVLQFRTHHSLAGSSETLSWVISNSCAHLGQEKKLPSHNLGPLLWPVTSPNTLWTTNTAVPAS